MFEKVVKHTPVCVLDTLMIYSRLKHVDLILDSNIILEICKANLISHGDQAFCNTDPILWNNLTKELRNTEKLQLFKSTLKVKPFKDHYK